MKTIRIKKIDGFDIVDGFGIAPIDPQATRERCKPIMEQTPEAIGIVKKSDERRLNYGRINQHKKNASALYSRKVFEIASGDVEKIMTLTRDKVLAEMTAQEKAALDSEEKLMQSYQAQDLIIDEQIKPLAAELEKKAAEILKNNPVYFEPRENEIVLTDQETSDLMRAHLAKTENQQLLQGGTYVDDFRGKQYFYKDSGGVWVESEVISALDVTMQTVVVDEYEAGAIEKADLTAGQLEEIRMQALDVAGKDTEKQSVIDSTAEQAAIMRDRLDIQGDAAADTKARDWYNAEVVKIEAKYA